jgi:hypothetical protein
MNMNNVIFKLSTGNMIDSFREIYGIHLKLIK